MNNTRSVDDNQNTPWMEPFDQPLEDPSEEKTSDIIPDEVPGQDSPGGEGSNEN